MTIVSSRPAIGESARHGLPHEASGYPQDARELQAGDAMRTSVKSVRCNREGLQLLSVRPSGRAIAMRPPKGAL